MAKSLFSCVNINLRITPILRVQSNKMHTKEVTTQEIQIPTKYGHLAAKLWGSNKDRPILALHGWQDNAGTWDTLVPMILKNRSILALDFPGHGLSSWIPPGMQYNSWDHPRLILYLKEYFKWDKVSLLCHSMGSIAGLRYASLFPDDVDFYIGFDNLIFNVYDSSLVVERYRKMLQKELAAPSRLDQEPPVYSLDEITQLWHLGSRKSVDLESVQHLLKRGAKQSKRDPTKYYISRDSRLKYSLFSPEDKKFVETVVRRVKCPTLYVKAIDSPHANDQFSVAMREVIENNNEKYEAHYVPGTHHVHLNNPDRIAPLIKNFLQKHNMEI